MDWPVDLTYTFLWFKSTVKIWGTFFTGSLYFFKKLLTFESRMVGCLLWKHLAAWFGPWSLAYFAILQRSSSVYLLFGFLFFALHERQHKLRNYQLHLNQIHLLMIKLIPKCYIFIKHDKRYYICMFVLLFVYVFFDTIYLC